MHNNNVLSSVDFNILERSTNKPDNLYTNNNISHNVVDSLNLILNQLDKINARKLYEVVFKNINNIEGNVPIENKLINMDNTASLFLSPKSFIEQHNDLDTVKDNLAYLSLFKNNDSSNKSYNQKTTLTTLFYNNKTLDNLNQLVKEVIDFKYVFIDTETTSLNNPLPVQITILITDAYFNILKYKNFYIYQQNISEDSIHIHKLTPKFLKENASDITEVFDYLDNLITYNNRLNIYQANLIGYNVKFDVRVLKNFYTQYGRSIPLYLNDSTEFCLYSNFNTKNFLSSLKPPNLKLTTIIHVLQLEDEIQNVIKQIYQDDLNSIINAHNSIYDTIAIYVLMRRILQI